MGLSQGPLSKLTHSAQTVAGTEIWQLAAAATSCPSPKLLTTRPRTQAGVDGGECVCGGQLPLQTDRLSAQRCHLCAHGALGTHMRMPTGPTFVTTGTRPHPDPQNRCRCGLTWQRPWLLRGSWFQSDVVLKTLAVSAGPLLHPLSSKHLSKLKTPI